MEITYKTNCFIFVNQIVLFVYYVYPLSSIHFYTVKNHLTIDTYIGINKKLKT